MRLLYNELFKIFSLWRSYISYGLVAILMPIILWAYGHGAENLSLDTFDNSLNDLFIMVGNIANGFTAAYFIMNFFYLHIPFLIILVGGDAFAGEAATGTFRIYLTRPVSRLRVFISKVLGAFIYVIIMMLVVAAMSLGLGVLWHGGGDMLVFHNGILILSQEDATLRFILAYAVTLESMLLVVTIALFFSVLMRNAVGPIIAAMCVLIFSYAFSGLPLNLFENIRRYFVTYYFDMWKMAFFDPIPWSELVFGILFIAAHIVVFLVTAAIMFNRKDIQS